MQEINSQIILSESFESEIENIRSKYCDAFIQIIESQKDFLVNDAKKAMQKAYLTSDKEKLIVLVAKYFTPIAQNKLLKILEEPPKKAHFIILTSSKSALLPTIRSRLSLIDKRENISGKSSGLDMDRFDLGALYSFLQEHKRVDAKQAASLVQAIAKETMKSKRFDMDDSLLNAFADAVRLLDMGSPASFILTQLGVKLLQRKL